MPRIFDNIDKSLLPALQETIDYSKRADFCVGYFNLRDWKHLANHIQDWTGAEDNCVRLLVGMQRLPKEELKEALLLSEVDDPISTRKVYLLKRRLADEFRKQLTYGIPTNEDEEGLRVLVHQLKTGKVKVKLFLRYPLHAKLYLLFRKDPNNPITGYLGSSNLTLSGLSIQGELNIDVLDHDATQKLVQWFVERWEDKWCIDITAELIEIINESWAREDLLPPYYIYIKMAYHLAQEARMGINEYTIPKVFGEKLFEFQKKAVQIAAHHINKRDGVMIGDVVGLGKTLIGTALARIFEDDRSWETLIICPKNLVKMWNDYREKYGLRGRVLSSSKVIQKLHDLKRYRLIIIDESHNLRNREGKRYKAIEEYIEKNDSKVILLTATPYNKEYTDLSTQLRLFVPEHKDIGIRPDRLIKELGIYEFNLQHQCPARSLAAFEKSHYIDDWRELMRLYLVRRTRSFIMDNYAEIDQGNNRKFLRFEDGTKSYFPDRIPKTVKFKIDDSDPNDQYARLYADDIVDTIHKLSLPRYGIGNYFNENPPSQPTPKEEDILADLSRAGKRLMGFCRTNLFKRLESSGYSFLLSVERHILRNFIFLHAIENNLPIPIGQQDSIMLNPKVYDKDAEDLTESFDLDDENDDNSEIGDKYKPLRTEEEFRERARQIYNELSTTFKKRFKWIRSDLFIKTLGKNILYDARLLINNVLQACPVWDEKKDTKLESLEKLLCKKHPSNKIIIFSQFADTVDYVVDALKKRGVIKLEGATGNSADPTRIAYRFSPESNEKGNEISTEDELRIVISTDVLSEGQNLQDCAIIVNYDLPWAIIRLIQRAGRIDRIGQKANKIICYTFLPAEGVDRIIYLRDRLRNRLKENAEVVGTDEAFFEDDKDNQVIVDLYNEKAGIFDTDIEADVDLASMAYEIWNKAVKDNPELKNIIPKLPDVIYSSKSIRNQQKKPEGAIVYMQTSDDNDALAFINRNGENVTESQFEILNLSECKPDTQPVPKLHEHHELVHKGVKYIVQEQKYVGGQLGKRTGARYRIFERLKNYAEAIKDQLFATQSLNKAIEDIYKYPLRSSAKDILNRQLRSGISDHELADIVVTLYEEERLCIIQEEQRIKEPQIICSMGLVNCKEKQNGN